MLTTSYEYSGNNLPIQMQLSEKSKKFCQFFIACLEFTLNFDHFEKKWASEHKYFWSYWIRKTCLLKCIKGLVSENPLAVNLLVPREKYPQKNAPDKSPLLENSLKGIKLPFKGHFSGHLSIKQWLFILHLYFSNKIEFDLKV